MNQINNGKFKEVSLFLLDILYNAAIIIALVLLIRGFLASPFRVVGQSMADTLENNELILIDKLSYRIGEIHRGDPIVFLPPITSLDRPKFEATAMADLEGKIQFNLNSLKGIKNSENCQKNILRNFWFCQEHVNTGDRAYFIAENQKESPFHQDSGSVNAIMITKETIKKGVFEWNGDAGTNYAIKIYNSAGSEHFVKRVIGIPGDTVKIENGQTYLKKQGDTDFTQIEQGFLNEANVNKTHMYIHPDQNVFVVPEGQYFVLGDNREKSSDSRIWEDPITQSATPFVTQENITGKVFIVLWPFDKIQLIQSVDLGLGN